MESTSLRSKNRARGAVLPSRTPSGPGVRIIEAGRPRAAAYQHTGASTSSQQLASWVPYKGSPDSDLGYELDTLVSRSRDLARNNGIAQGAIQTLTDNIVGPSFRLVALPDWRALGQTRDWAEEWAAKVEALWRGYADSSAIDAARRSNFAGLTHIFLRSLFLSGAGLALPIWQPEKNDLFATRIFLVEPDRLSNPNDSFDTATRRGGIDIDEYGRPLAYWLRNSHPGDFISGATVPGTWQRIPAETSWGRRRVIHAADIERPGQTRGKPIFSAVMQQFKMLDRYANAELDAAVTNALVAAVIETPVDFQDLVEMLNADGITGTGVRDYLDQRALPQNRARLKSGSIVPLYPGEKLASFNPARPATGFSAFMETTLRHIATGVNIPYELLAKDWTKTTYSSARAAMLEAWRYFKGKREWLAAKWAKPAYQLWLEEVVNDGLVDAPDFYVRRAAYSRSRWIGAARGWVDPVKEANAAQIRIEAGLSTMEAECAEQEGDYIEIMYQQAREQDLRRELGLPEYAPPHTVQVIDEPIGDPSAVNKADVDEPAT